MDIDGTPFDPAGRPFIVPKQGGKLYPVQKGEKRNAPGRRTFGTYVKEHINSMACQLDNGNLTWADIATKAKTGEGNERIAAVQLMQMVERADMADYEPAINGEKTLKEIREDGINTALIKRVRQRRITTTDEKGNQVVEITRDLELHDRAGEAFTRLLDQTDGKPGQAPTVEVNVQAVQVKVIRGVSMDDI